MNSEKIGKFIALNRKKKGLTQEQLAERLGVTNKTVSRWETGKYMPDLSLLKPLSEQLGVSLNELLSGEEIAKEKILDITSENIINTINYSKQKIDTLANKISIILMIIGAFISISALTIFEKESSWCCIYSIIGIIIFVVGIVRNFKKLKIIIGVILFILIFGLFYIVDYIGVKTSNRPPIYNYKIETRFMESKEIAYYSLFYNVYRINADKKNEYYIIDEGKKYSFDTVPITPFNINKSGIDNILKYQNKYVENNSNTGNLINNLPLSEYGLVFEIDPDDFGITINYNVTDLYMNDNFYVEKSLIYNSVSMFLLIDNLSYIKYNFSGNSYEITRKMVEDNYPNYNKIKNETIDKEKFNMFVFEKMNDNDFVLEQFKVLFNNG